MKSTFVKIFVLMIVLSMVLVACGTPKTTEEPVVTARRACGYGSTKTHRESRPLGVVIRYYAKHRSGG